MTNTHSDRAGIEPADDQDLLAPKDREAQLWLLFDLLLKALAREIVQPNVKASLLQVARQFLRDQDIKADGRADLRKGLESVLTRRAKLPFDA